jgi:hypothetical protein
VSRHESNCSKTAAQALVLLLLSVSGIAAGAEPVGAAVEATTAHGDRVLLHPNGRWEYVNPQKAAAARKVAEQHPENQGCPAGSQGGLLGFGRCIMPGDKDYNRGSLNPNRR